MARKTNWNKPYAIEALTVHRDPRGALYEALRFSSQDIHPGGQIYVYTVEPGARRGDHFHEKKSEWFTCVAGRVRLLMKTNQGERVDETLDATTPMMVFAGPGTSHAVVNETQEVAVIMAYASKEFDPADPDTTLEPAS
jgi:UDP-2-acetamido-2,6-beta-L-arabino-hexul-4-ose reductase